MNLFSYTHYRGLFTIDPKVEVIYISPVELNDEVYQYYSKLLGMKARRPNDSDSKGTGDEEEDDIENRYKIIVPDAVDRFPVGPTPETNALAGYIRALLFLLGDAILMREKKKGKKKKD